MSKRPFIAKARGVKKKELRELLAHPDTQLDAELCDPRRLIETYRLPGDRLLTLHMGKHPTLFESRAEYIAMIREAEAEMAAGPVHLLRDRLPQGRDFPSQVPALIDQLAEVLRIPREALDGSVASLDRLDAGVRRHGPQRCLEPEVFPAILAYAGEVVRKAQGGQWEMSLADDGVTWEPWILDGVGRAHALFGGIYKELYEQGKRSCSVGGVVLAALGPRLQGPPPTRN